MLPNLAGSQTRRAVPAAWGESTVSGESGSRSGSPRANRAASKPSDEQGVKGLLQQLSHAAPSKLLADDARSDKEPSSLASYNDVPRRGEDASCQNGKP